MSNFFFGWFLLPLTLFLIGLISFLVGKILHKKRMTDVSLCFISWLTLSFLLPSIAKKRNVINKWWLSIILMLISPPALATYYIVATEFIGISPYSYNNLKFTNKGDIIALTGLSDFPDYDYATNTWDGWDGTHYVQYIFKEEPSHDFYGEIESHYNQADNLFWSKDSLAFDEDKKFYGCDSIYIFRRGWDGQYIMCPTVNVPENATIELFIGKKGFICKYSEHTNISFDCFGNRDSISVRTGVQFPPFNSVHCFYSPCGPDFSESWIIMLDEKPSNEFIRQIKTSSKWKRLEDKPENYEFEYELPVGGEFESVIVDLNSRVVFACFYTI